MGGRQGQFKRKARGRNPAANVRFKAAVPHSPPHRSPNPSPERPRSTLAVAALVTTLRGRSVALPQSGQRSFSESDASHLQNQESYIEPYATVTELLMGPNWKSDGDEKSALQSVDVSVSCCKDEDSDTFASNMEKEPEPTDQEESVGSEAVCAVLQGKRPVSSSTEVEEDESLNSWLVHRKILVEEIEPSVEPSKVKKVEKALIEKPPPTPDVILHKRQGQMALTIEKFQKLKEENWHLNNANQTLLSELGEMKLQLKELQLKMKNFKKENAKLKENEQNSHREEELAELRLLRLQAQDENDSLKMVVHHLKVELSHYQAKSRPVSPNEAERVEKPLTEKPPPTSEELAEIVLLRQQNKEFVDEIDSLKIIAHHLNVELSRYQAKYRPISSNEGIEIGGLPGKGPPPPWLLDTKYLSPLLLAYEDKMKEMEGFIHAHEKDMKKFKGRVEELVKENEQLHQQLCKCNSVSTKEWQQLKSQAKLILEENAILMEQLKLQQAKAKDKRKQHVQEVSKLTEKLTASEAKRESQQEEIKMCQKQLEELQSTIKGVKASFKDCVTTEEHMASINRLKRRSQKKIDFLIQQWEKSMEKEEEAYQHLEKMIIMAENGIKDRDRLLTLNGTQR